MKSTIYVEKPCFLIDETDPENVLYDIPPDKKEFFQGIEYTVNRKKSFRILECNHFSDGPPVPKSNEILYMLEGVHNRGYLLKLNHSHKASCIFDERLLLI